MTQPTTNLNHKSSLAWAHISRSGSDSFKKTMLGANSLPIFAIALEDDNLFLQQLTQTRLGKITSLGDAFFEINLASGKLRKKYYIMGAGMNFVFNRFSFTDADGCEFELHVPKRGKRMLKAFKKAEIAINPETIDQLNRKLKEAL